MTALSDWVDNYSKEELYAVARLHQIEGRSSMNKEDLAHAIWQFESDEHTSGNYSDVDSYWFNTHQDYLDIVNHPMVESVGGDDTVLLINTLGITLNDPDPEYGSAYLGKFRIEIERQPRYPEISLHNIDNKKCGEIDHPHVYEGYACFGDIHSLVYTLAERKEWMGFLEIILYYLSSFNPGDNEADSAKYWIPVNSYTERDYDDDDDYE